MYLLCVLANIWLMPSNCLNSLGPEIASGMQFSNNTDNLRTMTMEQQMETETNAFACIITGRSLISTSTRYVHTCIK